MEVGGVVKVGDGGEALDTIREAHFLVRKVDGAEKVGSSPKGTTFFLASLS